MVRYVERRLQLKEELYGWHKAWLSKVLTVLGLIRVVG
jgi:hypothetical protein